MSDHNIRAILSAVDRNFSSTLDSAQSKLSSLKTGIMQGFGQKLFSTATDLFSSVTDEINNSNKAWKTFEGNMRIFGKSEGEISAVRSSLEDYATKTVYTASDMASTYSQLAAVGVDNCLELVEGFGGLAAAAENPQQAMKTLSQQATQMAAKPTVAWMDFKLMLEQTPAGISAVAKEMGMTTDELVSAVQDGTVATKDFFDAVSKVGNADGFTKMAQQYKTLDQAMDGVRQQLAVKLGPAFDRISQVGIDALSKLIDWIGQLDLSFGGTVDSVSSVFKGIKDGADGLGSAFAGAKTPIQDFMGVWHDFTSFMQELWQNLTPYLDALKEFASSILPSIGSAVGALAGSFGEAINSILTNETVMNVFKATLDAVKGVIEALSGFIDKHSDSLVKMAGAVVGAIAAYKGIKGVVSTVKNVKSAWDSLFKKPGGGNNGDESNPFSEVQNQGSKAAQIIRSVFQGIGDVIKSTGKAISDAAQGIGKGLESAFKGVSKVVESIGKAIGTVIESIGTAVSTMAQGIGQGISTIFQGIGQMMAIANPVTVLAFGAAISMVVLALAVLATQSEGVSQIIESIGTAFANAAPFVTALGSAVAEVITAIGNALPQLGVAVATVVTAFAEGFATAVTAVSEGLSNVLESAGSFLESFGSTVESCGEGVKSAFEGAGSAIESFGNAVESILNGVASVIESIGNAALNAGTGFENLANGVKTLTELNLLDMAASLAAVATGIGAITAAGVGITDLGTGMTQLATALTLINTNSSVASAAMQNLANSFSAVSGPLSNISSTASAAMSQFASALMSGAAAAVAAGKTIGQGVKSGIQSGLSSVGSLAQTAMNKFVSAMSSGASRSVAIANQMANGIQTALSRAGANAYQAGAYIGQGLANGMASMLGYVQQMAAQLADAADKAIQAKAKIGSPSKVQIQNGKWFGEGFGIGIERMHGFVESAAEALLNIPYDMAENGMKLSYAGMDSSFRLSDEYSYYRDNTIRVEVPLYVNGREFAHATYNDNMNEQSRQDKIRKRLKGVQ